MGNSVYQINKGINKAIEFKGLKAQYIWYLAGGLVGLLILFAIVYIAGVNPYICVAIVFAAGTLLVLKVYALSNKYGEYGMMKKLARRLVPTAIKSTSRRQFKTLKNGKVS